MDSKQKNILRASVRVVVAASAAFLAWISDALLWFLRSQPKKSESIQEFDVLVEDGVLKTKGGGHEATMDLMQGEESS